LQWASDRKQESYRDRQTRLEVSGDGMDHDVIIRKDPRGSGKILEIIVLNKKFIK